MRININKAKASASTAVLVVLLSGCQIDTPKTSPAPNTSGVSETPGDKPGPTEKNPGEPTRTAVSSPPVKNGVVGSALVALNELPVKGRAPKTGYSRKEFKHWLNVGDGCKADDAAIKRYATVELKNKCREVAGNMIDPYSNTGEVLKWGTKRTGVVDIDHIVSLGDAWQKGAQQLSREERAALANDQLNLIPVSDNLNRQKSDSDAASWLPPNVSYRPDYVATQIAVKKRYNLWVTQAEKDAMLKVLNTKPEQPLPTGRKVVVEPDAVD